MRRVRQRKRIDPNRLDVSRRRIEENTSRIKTEVEMSKSTRTTVGCLFFNTRNRAPGLDKKTRVSGTKFGACFDPNSVRFSSDVPPPTDHGHTRRRGIESERNKKNQRKRLVPIVFRRYITFVRTYPGNGILSLNSR